MFCFLIDCDREHFTSATDEPVRIDTLINIEVSSRFVTHDYIELDKIERISKFRSGIGHDYRDDAESCRSMKHYYQPKTKVDWSSVKIFSPVSGTIMRAFDEWAGTQLQIQPFDQPNYSIIIFHVAMNLPRTVGDTVLAGEELGHHISSQTMSDIAVGYSDQNTWKLISFVNILTDSLFQHYIDRGVSSRDQLVISKEVRDADPLGCSGEVFGTSGTIENWKILN